VWSQVPDASGSVFVPAPRLESEPMSSYPEPEVRAVAADLTVVPRGVKSYTRVLDRAGLPYDVRYARGTYPNAKGEPTKVVDSYSVRTEETWGARIACVWVEGKLDLAMIREPGEIPYVANMDKIKRFLGFEVAERKPVVRKPKLVAEVKIKDSMR
jgi:hypothetical protein